MAKIKMGNYNINSLCGDSNHHYYLLKLMKENDYDIICLQETKASKEKVYKLKDKLIEEDIKVFDKYGVFAVESVKTEGHRGCAIYYKKDKQAPVYKDEYSDDLDGRILTVEYEQFYLINAYLPNSANGKQAKKDKKQYLNWLIDLPCRLDKPCIILGDMNVKGDYRDNEARPKERSNAGTFNFEKELFQDLLDKGFVDVFSYVYPTDEAVAEHLKSAPDIYEDWHRLDYCLISAQLTKNIVDCKVHTDFVYRQFKSQHLPLEMTIDI